MDKSEILMKPHHFVDILTAYGKGQTSFLPHPFGHALHIVAKQILEQHDLRLWVTTGVDCICTPCRHNAGARCADTMPDDFTGFPEIPRGKEEWNTLIDTRWCEELGLSHGDSLTASEMCRRLLDATDRIPRVYRELPEKNTIDRKSSLEKGLRHYLHPHSIDQDG